MRRHLTYANVVATLALVVAVGGGSTAIAISAKKAPKNSVTSASIRDGSVTGRDLAPVRVERILTSSLVQDFECRPGEQFLNGGTGGEQLIEFGPIESGNGFRRSGRVQSAVTIACLAAKPGK